MGSLADLLPPVGSDPTAVLDAFSEWAVAGGEKYVLQARNIRNLAGS